LSPPEAVHGEWEHFPSAVPGLVIDRPGLDGERTRK
jgi:hypothetical protein